MEKLRPYTFKVKVTYSDGETEMINVKENGFFKACEEIRLHRKNHEIQKYELVSSRSNVPKKEFKQWRKIARKIEHKHRYEHMTGNTNQQTISHLVNFLQTSHTTGKYPSIRSYYLKWDRKEYRNIISGIRARDPKKNNFFSRSGKNYDVNLWWTSNPFKPYKIN